MVFAGRKVFSDKTLKNRIFTEMYTAKWWHVLQVTILFIALIFLLEHSLSLFSLRALLSLQLLSQLIKLNSLNFPVTKPLILFTSPLGIFPKALDENLRNTHVSSLRIFLLRR
jgi:hypothetical protein